MTSKTPMQCPDVEKKLVYYLEDLVAPGERRLIEQHLAGCSGCRERLAALAATRQSAAQALQSLAAAAEPSQQAWNQLQTRLAREARPSPGKTTVWKQRLAQGASRTPMRTSQGANIMRKPFMIPALAAVIVIAVIGVFLTQNATPVSAQQILARATAAQSAAARAVGIRHTKIETYRNPQALDGEQPGMRTTGESYYDLGMGYMRSVTVNDAGKLTNVFAYDGKYTYSPGPTELGITGDPTIYRVPQNRLSSDLLFSEESTAAARQAFDEFRSSTNVELEGKQTWTDGRPVYVLVERNVPTSKQLSGNESGEPTGTTKMIFDAQTYQLLENETTTHRDGKDIVLFDFRILVDEVLPIGTAVVWNLSDLKGVTFIDDPNAEHGETLPEVITPQELAAHTVDGYLLKSVPAGFSLEISAPPHQEHESVYIYIAAYRTPGNSDYIVIQSGKGPEDIANLGQDTYRTASGFTLYFLPPVKAGGANAKEYRMAIVAAPDGAQFVLTSTLPRERIQQLVEDLVNIK
jgi:hypothetical protein